LPELKTFVDTEFFRGKYYAFFHTKLTWQQAKKNCEKMGGRLVVIGNKKLNELLLKRVYVFENI